MMGRHFGRTAVLLAMSLLGYGQDMRAQSAAPASLTALKQSFISPPEDARVMMRWWWFGPGVSQSELDREIRMVKEGGIGGFEIQPVYPLELDDPDKGFRNLAYLSDEFLLALRFANQKGKELGMRVDITLGSGWPFGGPHIPVTEAAAKLRMMTVPVTAGTDSVPLPNIADGEKLLAVFLAPGDPQNFRAMHAELLALPRAGELRLHLRPEPSVRTALFFVASRTGQMVKRPAIGAEGFVLDHFDRAAIEHHLHAVGDRMIQAFGNDPPYAIFSDSLESYEADWTPKLLEEFRTRRGYDLLPHLPALFADAGPDTEAIRHDWGETLTELVDENYLTPITAWAAQHRTRFRSQTYGTPAVNLSSNRLVDLAEGEGWHWRGFFDHALGQFRKSSVRTEDHLGGNLDLAAFARLPRHAARHESRGGPVLSCGCVCRCRISPPASTRSGFVQLIPAQ